MKPVYEIGVGPHSPMVLTSVETRFDTTRDVVWELDLNAAHEVVLSEYPWYRRGDANTWLTSTVFDLQEPRSLEAEQAITAALALLQKERPPKAHILKVDQDLRASLGELDRFWVRWSAWREEKVGR